MFLVELPLDKYGNRAMTNGTPCVIEADERHDGGFTIVGPCGFSFVGSGVSPFFRGGWVECDGPARYITSEERDEIIERARGDHDKTA